MNLKNLKAFKPNAKPNLLLGDCQRQQRMVYVSDSSTDYKSNHFGDLSFLKQNKMHSFGERHLDSGDFSGKSENREFDNSADYGFQPREAAKEFAWTEKSENSEIAFKDQACIVSHEGMTSLKGEVLENFLKQLNGPWRLNELGHLERVFTFKDFKEAMSWANKIGDLAEKEDHHPDILISWGRCAVKIWTHAVNGLTKNDLILAAKIDELG